MKKVELAVTALLASVVLLAAAENPPAKDSKAPSKEQASQPVKARQTVEERLAAIKKARLQAAGADASTTGTRGDPQLCVP